MILCTGLAQDLRTVLIIEQDMALEESSIHFIHVIISLAILLFAAKLFAKIFHRLKLPIVLGELLAGIIVGPFAVGGLFFFNNEPIVELDVELLERYRPL
jgi:hypothetical protein